MAKLYDKSGKEFNVPHAVDVKDWLASKEYSLEKPKGAVKQKPAEKPRLNLSDKD